MRYKIANPALRGLVDKLVSIGGVIVFFGTIIGIMVGLGLLIWGLCETYFPGPYLVLSLKNILLLGVVWLLVAVDLVIFLFVVLFAANTLNG